MKKQIRKLLRNRNVSIGFFLTVSILAITLVGNLFVGDPQRMNFERILEAPSSQFLFGTDDFGRDLVARVFHGARLSMLIGFSVMIATTIVGSAIGLVAGAFLSMRLLMRVMDAMMAFPSLLLAIGLMAAMGSNAFNVVLALSIVYVPRMARVVESSVLQLREETYVEAAYALGIPTSRILFRHILPNGIAPIIVQSTFVFAFGVLAEAALSFVGIGVQPPTATLGNILGAARPMLREAPWLSFIPGAVIFSLVLGVNMLGDGLRVVMDPKETDIAGC